MIPKSCKRLAEVDFPIAEVSKHAAREKSIRHGHPSTLHLWWARRPLASSRAILLALLWPDPCDTDCPADFKEKAREMLPRVQGRIGKSDEDLRKALLKFIGNFANWDFSTNRDYLEISRTLVKIAHGKEIPLVVDPFAGGGSIPLEALRVGCDTFASDLNPVAVLINKVLLDEIPRNGPKLTEELRRVGENIIKKAENDFKDLYPLDPDGAKPLAYLWARTIRCESPNCGAEIPLVSSFWLSKNPKRMRALSYKIKSSTSGVPKYDFEIFKPNSDSEVPNGTVVRAKATCIVCGNVLPAERVRTQLYAQNGGAEVIFNKEGKRIGGAMMLSVVILREGETVRFYRTPTQHDYEIVRKSQKLLNELISEWETNESKINSPIPNESTPSKDTHRAVGSQLPFYGHKTWKDLFTSRQLILHYRLTKLVKNHKILPLMIGKILRHCNAFAFWHKNSETVAGAFGRQAIPMCWDFPEYVPFYGFAGSISNALGDITGAVSHITSSINHVGQVHSVNATNHILPDESTKIWFTDPPYYDAIPYADLSDFFFVWLKRGLSDSVILRDNFDSKNTLTPKKEEIVLCNKVKDQHGKPKGKEFYEEKMYAAFAEGRRILKEDGIGSIIFAHKTTEGWEALLSGIIKGGWIITGSWPIVTERGARLLARDTAALATSVHLICRPRPDNAQVGDWGKILRELPKRVGDWMEYLQNEGIRGADLVFACIGPALEIFSRYSRVETAEGEEVKLSVYLEKVWEVVGRIALENILGTDEAKARNGVAGALEEDARLTALFLWTLQSTKMDEKKNGNEVEDPADADDEDEEVPASKKGKGYSLVFDVVRRFAQPLGINLPKWEKRIIETQKGVVRLLPITERAKILFGKDGAQTVAAQLEMSPTVDTLQQSLFPEYEVERPKKSKRKGRKKTTVDVSGDSFDAQPEATTLDRLHAAMILQASGRTNALRTFLKEETDRNPDFLRLANALSALYPRGSEEKRLLDAMLLVVRR